MNLSELIDLVKLESGQYELDLEEYHPSKYKLLLTTKVLPIIYRYMPYTQDASVNVTTSPYTYITTDIPDWLAHVIPVGNVSATNIITTGQFRQITLDDIRKTTFLWQYRKPNLYMEYSGDMLITECYKAKLTETATEDYSIDLLKEDAIPYMADLLLGYVMKSIGLGRRAAKINELPIELDSDQLVTDGNEIVLSTIDNLKQDSDFYLALGD